MTRRTSIPRHAVVAVAAGLVTLAACAPDRATAVGPIAAQQGGPNTTIENLTTATILYDQRSSRADALFLSGGTPIFLADDFSVTGSLKVTQVAVSGVLSTPTLTFEIRANNAGTPGAAIAVFTLAPSSSDPNAASSADIPMTDYLFTLPTPVAVGPGTYWLAVQSGSVEDVDHFIQLFGWQRRLPVRGSSSLYSTNLEVTEWSSTLFTQPQPFDFAFVLFGDVVQQAQTITFPAITPNPGTIGGSATLGATASSGLAVSYTSLTTGVCTVNGSTVSYVAVGTPCTIAADQVGSATYLAAARVTQDVTVNRAAQAIAFTSTPPSPAVTGGTYMVTATGGASGNPVTFSSLTTGVCTMSGSTVSFIATGTCTVAADQTGNASYDAAAQKTQQVMVSKAPQTIVFTSTPPSPAVALGTYTVVATGGASGNPVAFSSSTPTVCSVIGSDVSFVAGGTCTMAANQAGSANYEPALQQTQSFAVSKVSQAITFTSSPPSPAYLNGTYAVVVSGGASGNPVVVTAGPAAACAVSGTTVTLVGVGTCTVAANQAGNGIYNAASQVTQTVAVAYGFEGFGSPVNNNGEINSAKAGQAIPLKWRLTNAAGLPVTNLTSATITAKELACVAGSTPDQLEEYAAGGSGLQNLGNGYYQLNWKTPASYKGSCKTLLLTLGDEGTTHNALFQFAK